MVDRAESIVNALTAKQQKYTGNEKVIYNTKLATNLKDDLGSIQTNAVDINCLNRTDLWETKFPPWSSYNNGGMYKGGSDAWRK